MFQKLKTGYARAGLAVTGLVGSGAAMAAEGDVTAYATAFSDIQTQAIGMITAAIPVVAAVLVAMVGLRMFKRVGNKI